MDRFEDGVDRLRFALSAQHRSLAIALGTQHDSLLLALGGEDLSLLLAFGRQDRRAPIALGAHLLLHRRPDVLWRVHRLDLDAVDAYAPLAGRLVQHDTQLGVDVLTSGQRVLERQPADHIAQRGDGQLLDRLKRIGYFVRRRAGIGDREIEDRFDRDNHVVFGDHRLRREVDNLLAQVHERLYAIDERRDERQTRLEGAAVATEPLHHARPCLRNDADRARGHDQREYDDNGYDNQGDHDGL